MPVSTEQLDRIASDMGLCRGCSARPAFYQEMRETASVGTTIAKWATVVEVAKTVCQRAAQQAEGALITGVVNDPCPALLAEATTEELSITDES